LAAPINPKGAKSDKEWRDALRLALHEEYEDEGKKSKALRLVARAVVKKAIEGDITAAKEIGDRLDGKAPQAITGENGGPLTVQIIRFNADDNASGE
jgi:hypothetical protein